jgi:hypothetical protein
MEKKTKQQPVASLRNIIEYCRVLELAIIVHRTEESLAQARYGAPDGGNLSVESEYYTKITSEQAFELFEGREEDLNLTFVGGEIRPLHNEWTADVDWAEGGWLCIEFNLLKNSSPPVV